MSAAGHVEGHPVNASTYCNRGCRCEGCTDAHRLYQQRMRSRQGSRTQLRQKAINRANFLAAQLVRESVPDVWADLLAEAEEYVGIDKLPKYTRYDEATG
jgi:hypothetical protein